ncbi:MAG: acyl transferase, partial [Bacteroidota bacterium]
PEYKDIFQISSEQEFNEVCLKVFRYQAEQNKVYSEYISHLNCSVENVNTVEDIPFLPIELFKSKEVFCGEPIDTEVIFSSSGTTGSSTSKHVVKEIEIYKESFLSAFELFYRKPQDFRILALLPSYLERTGSSLIYMVDELIKKSNHPESGFFLNNLDDLRRILSKKSTAKTLLIGVSFALLDIIENGKMILENTIVMETGGMKGRRKEITREELHKELTEGFGVSTIHSEYGMTELLSQAYSNGNGIFHTPPWMKVIIREPNDPLTFIDGEKSGGINVIDLANMHSCSFIATSDLGKIYPDGTFEVLGRFDYSDIRGCNLMVAMD